MAFLLQFSICFCFAIKVSSSVNILYENDANDTNSDKLVVRKDTAYAGGTNYFLIINLNESSPGNIKRINFKPDEENQKYCQQFSRNSHCENTVRILEVTSQGSVLICGTNARTPKCFYYNVQNASFSNANLDADSWLSESPTICTKSLVSNENITDNDYFYAASTKSEASGGVFVRKIPKTLETTKDWFDEPEFKGVHAAQENSNVYLFFNEKSSNFIGENFDGKHTKKDYYSMVARVCKNDQGGSWERDTWVTFNKARLTCPFREDASEDETSLFYNELISTFQAENSIFGLFRTNRNWKLTTYALAEFDLNGIDDVIEGKHFLNNKTMYFDKVKHKNEATYHPTDGSPPFLPGECPAMTSYNLKSEFERFVLGNTLVKMNILPKDGKPFFVSDEKLKYKFIFVQKLSSSNLVYLLSENGGLKKIAVFTDKTTIELFEHQTEMMDEVILAAELVEKNGYILATTASKVITIPLQFCSVNHDCGSCNADPHCQWSEMTSGLAFECKVADVTEIKTCSASPDSPKNLSTTLSGDEVQLSWNQNDELSQTSNIITIKVERTREIVFSEKTSERFLVVKRSLLLDGCDYEVTVTAVNNNAVSDASSQLFTTDLQKPEVTIDRDDDRIGVTWSRVSGAEKYIVQLIDDLGESTQKLIFLPTNNNNVFYFSDVEVGGRYNVVVRAISEDNVESSGNSQVVQAITAKAATMVATDCSALSMALAIVAAFLFGSLIIIIHNICIFKSRANELKNDDDGWSYRRKFLCIWSKKRNGTHLKCDNAVTSASNA